MSIAQSFTCYVPLTCRINGRIQCVWRAHRTQLPIRLQQAIVGFQRKADQLLHALRWYQLGCHPFPRGIQFVFPLELLSSCGSVNSMSLLSAASYDYGAAISESRLLTPKYTELKRQGLFLRSTPDFWKTDVVGNSTTGAVKASNSAAFGTLLQNPDTQARFYVMRQNDSTSTYVNDTSHRAHRAT